VKGTFTTKGSLVVSWTNPAANKGHADGVFVSLNGEIVAQHSGPMPTHLTVLPSHVPPGDLTLDVFVQSSADGTVAVTHSTVKARVPFSGTGTRVGSTRYRVTLQLAASWGRSVCHSAHCSGVKVRVTLGGRSYADYLDERGQAVVTVLSKPRLPFLLVKVTAVNSKYSKLNMARVHVVLSRLK
jgi:hypothetical protein